MYTTRGAHLIQQATQRPDVRLKVVAILVNPFRRHVIWCANWNSNHSRLTSKKSNKSNTYTTHNSFNGLLSGTTWPVPEETFTHSCPSWSSDILYQLPPFTMIHSILFIQFTCLTVLFHNLSPGPLWSSSWSWTLYFILHAFLHLIIIIFSQQRPIPSQPVLL